MDPRVHYALRSDQVATLLSRLLNTNLPDPGHRFACFCIPGQNRHADIARTLECRVFQDFFGNDPDVMVEAYATYEASSLFLLVVDQLSLAPAGVLRVITHSRAGFKTLNDIKSDGPRVSTDDFMRSHQVHSLSDCWDVGTLAVTKPYRGDGHLVSSMLYGMFHRAACRAGISHAMAILDGHAYRQVTQTLAIPFVPLAGTPPFSYLGSAHSQAACVSVPEIAVSVAARIEALEVDKRPALEPVLARIIYERGLPETIRVR